MAIVTVTTDARDLGAVRELFLEYAGTLDFDLCFQSFDAELAGLPGSYAPPGGTLLLARVDGAAAGCIGVRPLDAQRCEMKRLYVRPQYRDRRLGRQLVEQAIVFARGAGYRSMVLDTLPQMAAALKLYRDRGFRPCAPYYDNTPLHSSCMELPL